MGQQKLEFSSGVEHVGILRSVDVNLPNILDRMSAHTRAVRSVLPVGLAKGHKGNPAACLRIELLYGSPVLLSGLPSLVLSKSEISILHHHYKLKLEKLQKLHRGTPECVVFFLGGSLPLTALLHIRQLSILSMISRLGPSNILHKIGTFALLNSKPSSRSWFLHVRNICSQYSLPDPLTVLNSPPTKSSYKSLVKSKITDFYEVRLRLEASNLPSLAFFRPQFYSLRKPHPIWLSAGSNPYEVEKAVCQAKMLSGRYRTCYLARHWSGNSAGHCSLPDCCQTPTLGTLTHILTECKDLHTARLRVFSLWADFMQDRPILIPVIMKYTTTSDPSELVQFLLDCTVLPDVIDLVQKLGKWVHDSLFYLTRTFCFSIHKTRLKLLGKWDQ